mmetsp:Transcript_32762/g.55280  ORF Transcript_32762/g.55280 Transcript_32762/m.55280 type:complete len:98 (+) Transcript_32762:785-1078(+)
MRPLEQCSTVHTVCVCVCVCVCVLSCCPACPCVPLHDDAPSLFVIVKGVCSFPIKETQLRQSSHLSPVSLVRTVRATPRILLTRRPTLCVCCPAAWP